MTSITSGRVRIGCRLALFLLITAGCAGTRGTADKIRVGQTMEEARATAGAPDETMVFTLPDGPFFGPQEGLADLLPAGTTVEEWQYRSGENVIYVWFVGDATEPRETWTVIETAAYPAGAVY